jgi:tetraacyldisaccharide 4'-kinase
MCSLINPYVWAVYLRNRAYDCGVFSSYKAELPCLVIGNLSSGGTGKTPTAAWILSLLRENGIQPAFLSRGYGRKTKGMYHVNSNDSPSNCGDEPLWIKQTFPDIPVLCSENRLSGIAELKREYSNIDLVVLDDGFQHRRLKADFYLLLISAYQFKKQYKRIPFGKYRESMKAANRADAVFLTKLSEAQDAACAEALLSKHSNAPVWRTPAKHSLPEKSDRTAQTCLITGLAETGPLCEFLNKEKIYYQHLKYTDHHIFRKEEIQKFHSMREKGMQFLTTAKDQVRLQEAGITFAQVIHYRLEIPEEAGKWIINKVNEYVEQYRAGKRIHS